MTSILLAALAVAVPGLTVADPAMVGHTFPSAAFRAVVAIDDVDSCADANASPRDLMLSPIGGLGRTRSSAP